MSAVRDGQVGAQPPSRPGVQVPTARTLDDLRGITDDEALVAAAGAYLDRVRAAQREARALRNAAVARLVLEHGPSEAARRAGLSLTTVKALRG